MAFIPFKINVYLMANNFQLLLYKNIFFFPVPGRQKLTENELSTLSMVI